MIETHPRGALAAPPNGSAATSRAPTIWTYGIVLLRHRTLMLGIPAVAVAVAVAVSLSAPREYVAPASFVPQEPSRAASGLGQVASQLGIAPLRPDMSSAQFYMDLLQSREVLRSVLRTSYRALGDSPGSASLIGYFGLQGLDSSAAVISGIRELRRIIDVRGDRTTGLVRLEVHTTNPQLSVQVAARFLELVNDYNMRRRQSQARAERQFVEQRLTASQQALSSAEYGLAAFYGRNRRFADSPVLTAEESRLERVVMLRQQLYLNLAQNHELAKIEEVRNTPVITVVESPEGFVEARSRGTLRTAAVAGILAVFFAAVLTFLLEYLHRARVESAEEYREFALLRPLQRARGLG